MHEAAVIGRMDSNTSGQRRVGPVPKSQPCVLFFIGFAKPRDNLEGVIDAPS